MTVIYCGKITWLPYAPSTIITVVVPNGINTGKPCLIYWQWAVTKSGAVNYNVEFTGAFVEKTAPMVECRGGADSYYWFTWNLRTNTLVMMDMDNIQSGDPVKLEKVFPV